MGFQLSSQDDELVENHDINVTPFVDVMLVLLIIVMVAAPLATVNIPVDLPTSTVKSQPKSQKPFYLTIEKDSTITLGEDLPVAVKELKQAIAKVLPDKDKRIYLRADKTISYDRLMAVMNELIEAGYYQIALVGAEVPKEQS